MDIGFTGTEARNTRHEAEFIPSDEITVSNLWKRSTEIEKIDKKLRRCVHMHYENMKVAFN